MPIIGQKIKASVANFADMVNRQYMLVDKTLMIKEFWEGEDFSLITRPRRFGKSMTLSMLQHFFAETVDDIATKGLFKNFAIANVDNGHFLSTHQGQYPVILVSFKDVKEKKDYDSTINTIRILIKDLCSEHERFLNQSTKLTETDKKELAILREGGASVEELENALKVLSRLLYRAYNNKKVIILIDEYDAPLTTAYEYQFLDRLSSFMRNLFSAALKDNRHVQKGLMTGVLRVSQSGMLSGLNNLSLYSVFSPQYQCYFGFEEAEVCELLQKKQERVNTIKLGSAELFQSVKSFYNGYQVVKTTLYNPWSIMQFMTQLGFRPKRHSVLTADDTLLKKVLLDSSKEVKGKISQLMLNESVECGIELNLRYEDLMRNPNAIWTLLLFGGYLTLENQAEESDSERYRVKIPNQEVLRQYEKVFITSITDVVGVEKYDSFLNNLIDGHVEEFTKDLGGFMLQALSVKDVSGDKEQPERFYHGMMIGVMSGLRNKYHILSNREGGMGFYDTMLIPKENKDLALILEYKRCKSNQDMVTVAKEALAQIDALHYSANLADYPHVKRVMNVGLAFRDKSVQSAYEVKNVASGKRIGDISLSEEYGSDEERKDVAGSSSVAIDVTKASSSNHDLLVGRWIVGSEGESSIPRVGFGMRRSRITADFADESVDEQGPLAAPSASKVPSGKPQKELEEEE